jgi:predicted DsbA family dithiol-disulfide isomerase
VVTWLESIKTEVDGGLKIHWKAFSLEQQNNQEDENFRIWEQRDYPSRGVLALVASKATLKQGDSSFFKFHRATFEALHDEGEDIADGKVIMDIAEKVGLDVGKFGQDMNRDETWHAVGEDHTESKTKYNVFGVPTLIFGQGKAVYVKLQAIPESKEEQVSLFNMVYHTGVKRPYLLELKRPDAR